MNGVFLSDLALVCGGHLEGDDLEVTSVSTNSRTIQVGDVFVCLTGENFDGHDYALSAIENGAVAVVAETAIDTAVAQLVVPDTTMAFGLLAMLWRQRLPVKLIGVTGSNGKTTVKQLLASICRASGTVHATQANDNNQIGVPQTLMGISEQHQFAVVEMGANQLGEIQWLSSISQPSVALITNVSASHLEGFGSVETVAQEKSAIYDGLTDDGVAIVNADDPFAGGWLQKNAARRTLTFGRDSKADVWAERLDGTRIGIFYNGESVEGEFLLPGEHNILNAAAAAAAAIAAGVSLQCISTGLAGAEAVRGRLNFHYLESGHILIDDTYNANPASTRAAIDVLLQQNGRKILVLGDLRELGEDARQQHEIIGRYAREHGVDLLLAYGSLSRYTAGEFSTPECFFEDKELLLRSLLAKMTAPVAVLVKGSRSMRMEEVVAAVLQSETAKQRMAGESHR